jgi:uncharacterized protein YdaU (DUF1376 family)
MPFYVGDYLADTQHLNGAQHGAYLLLIMHYWAHGGLPDDNRRLARIARTRLDHWVKMVPVIGKFFHDGWHHKRIDAELAKQEIISTKRLIAGMKGNDARAAMRMARGKSSHANAYANATQTVGTTTIERKKEKKEATGEASKGLAASPELEALMEAKMSGQTRRGEKP